MTLNAPLRSLHPSRRWGLALLAALALAGGYADLARGGLTAGACLLVAAYIVLLPAWLLEA